MIYLSTVCKEKAPSLIHWLTGRPLNMSQLTKIAPVSACLTQATCSIW